MLTLIRDTGHTTKTFWTTGKIPAYGFCSTAKHKIHRNDRRVKITDLARSRQVQLSAEQVMRLQARNSNCVPEAFSQDP